MCASGWLNDEKAILGSIGEKAFRNALNDALFIGENAAYDDQRKYIYGQVDYLNKISTELCEFIQKGRVSD